MCFVCFILESIVQNKRNLAQALKVGTWRYELKNSLWKKALLGLLSMADSLCLFISTQNHLPKGSSTHNELGLPTSINNYENSFSLVPNSYCV